MADALRFHVRPTLRDPLLLLAFEGWNDAGESPSGAARYVAEAVGTAPLAEIDAERFYDFTAQRPQVRIEAGGVRRIEWPRMEFRYGSLDLEREIVIGVGPEPQLCWRTFSDEVVELVRGVGVREVVLLGAYLADVLYSRPVAVTGFGSESARLERAGVRPSGYEGPTGIVGVLGERFRREGLVITSLWAALPHYISAQPNPRGALSLLHALEAIFDLRVDLEPLRAEAADFEQKISALVASDPELAEYVRELKRREFAQ